MSDLESKTGRMASETAAPLLPRAEALAEKVMNYSRDSILVNMRFLDVALSGLIPVQRMDIEGFASDGAKIYYNPLFLLKRYKEEPAFAVRMYLHILF
ncbi:MAG: hypothetical protein K2P30_08315, partial [Lachnospiraceae bacterium]|nr:hypothetical protein [Lachnospiraceae bacterium]